MLLVIASLAAGGDASRAAYREGLAESAQLYGCDFAHGWVYVGGRCQLAADVIVPPELLEDGAAAIKFGVATSAYQIEGAAREGGRGVSIWDVFSHTPGRVANGETGDVAIDHYHRYREDFKLLSSLGIDTYRMSIAWPRVMPDTENLNSEGIAFYHRIFDELRKYGIEPFVTLYHWDLPQQLEDQGGWRNKSMIVPKFERYASAMFNEYGSKVKRWVTFNEPATFTFIASDNGLQAPGRCSDRSRCPEGDSLTEPLIIAHSVLVAHAYAVRALRQLSGPGEPCEGCRVGMVNCIKYTAPMDSAREADWQAAQWRMESELGIWTDPIYFGDYPASVVEASGSLLPPFSPAEKELLRGSVDYFGLNLYTAQFARARFARPNAADTGVMATSGGELNGERGDLISQARNVTRPGPAGGAGGLEPVGVPGSTGWLIATPGAMRNTLNWIAQRYGAATEIVITEAGCADQAEAPGSTLDDALNDQYRIAFLFEYIRAAAMATVVDGVNVTGFQAWSAFDNFEWQNGYSQRFGLVRVQYDDDLKRIPKASFAWYQQLINATHAARGAASARLLAVGPARAVEAWQRAPVAAALAMMAAIALAAGAALLRVRRAPRIALLLPARLRSRCVALEPEDDERGRPLFDLSSRATDAAAHAVLLIE